MSTVKKEIMVSAKSEEVGQVLIKLIISIKAALADGFQIGDIPTVVLENITGLMTAMQDLNQVPVEAKEDVAAFVKSWACTGGDIAKVLIG